MGKIIVLYISIFKFLDSNLEDKSLFLAFIIILIVLFEF
jgi:hypothetical protein